LEPDIPDEAQLARGARNWRNQWHTIGKPHALYEEFCQAIEDKIESGYRVIVGARNPWIRVAAAWRSDFRTRSKTPREFVDLVTAGKINQDLRPSVDFSGPNPWFVIRFENLQEDWKALCGLLDIDADLIPDNVVSDDACPVDAAFLSEFYADPYVKDWVARTFQSDLDMFGYECPVPYYSKHSPAPNTSLEGMPIDTGEPEPLSDWDDDEDDSHNVTGFPY
jgi:hypothetical protein